MITVIDVMRAMRVEITPELSWSVGNIVRGIYEARTGTLPVKELRPKTDMSGGTHCFAVYPYDMWNEIERVVRAHVTEAARQLSLF
jgi:hypothetical protein